MQNITIATQKHRLLALLLPSVEAAGMVLSPDRYIRLQRLWQMLSDDCPIDTMQNLLSPVFATDERQQDAFMDIFAHVVRQDLELPAPLPKPDLPEKKVEKTDIPIDEPKQDIKPIPPTSTPIDVPQAAPQRRSLVVELDRCTEPPYTWNIAPKNNETEINIGAGFNKTLLQLRRRESADYTIIDLPATIKATIAQGGLPTFRYLRQTRPPEYLLLVERFSRNDHRAGLFDYVFQSLRANDVFVERFFYDSDPRINRNEQYPAGLNLYELRNRYPDSRLVLLGSGYRLLISRTGKLAEWALPLLNWRVRALLTPVSRTEWGYQERQLDLDFLLLPASVESLQYIAESLDAGDAQYESLPDYIREIAETEPIQLKEPIMRSLRQHFDSGMLSWVAACAVYPALHFELTLQLGKVLSESLGYNLVTASNLLTLSRLSWFTSGMIPVPVRKDLMKYLEQRHPERRMLVLEYLLKLMKENPPTNENSVAYAEHRVNLAVMKAMTGEKPDAETVAELRAVVKRLDRDAGWGDFVLPEVWEEILGTDIEPISVSDKEDNDSKSEIQNITKKFKILVIEDEPLGRQNLIIKIKFVDKNIDIDEAENFADVIDNDLSVFDLITTDVNQVKGNSYGYIKQAKEKFPNVPIVLISAMDRHPQDILNLCNGYLIKPTNDNEVRGVINTLKKGELGVKFNGMSGSIQKVFEAQLIVIGEPGSGKTTLVQKLIDKNALMPKENEATKGIEKLVYSFVGENWEQYRVTITDFGRQERLQATNQLLYKQNALYLLVYNNDYSNSNIEKWLESVKMYGGGSPVILVHNAVNDRPEYYDASDELLTRFPFLIEQYSLNLGKNTANLDTLTRAIQKNIQQLPHVGSDMPTKWVNVRNNLEQLGLNKPYIYWEDYLEVCGNNGINDEIAAENIATYLHNLGSILYYSNNALLKRIVILRPNWATETIYGILDDEDIRNRKGYFSSQELEKALLNQEWASLKPELIELLKLFEICYQVPGKDLFIIPKLLPNYPQHTWDLRNNLQFELHYSAKPVDLFNRFIVLRHTDIDNDLVGKYQVILKWNQTFAQITEFDNKIKIRIRGKEAKDFLQIIQNTFDSLHDDFITLKVDKFVPCKCSECLNSENPHLYDYTSLLKVVESNRDTILCPKSYYNISIRTLLEDVEISKSDDKPLRAFISYSKNDIEYVTEFRKQIQPLIRSNELILDDDTQILLGEDWDRKISMDIMSADIIFLMISADFLDIDYIWEKGLSEAMSLREMRQKIVVPIILRPCDWQDSPFGKLQGLPRNNEVISTAKNRDQVWAEIVRELSGVIRENKQSKIVNSLPEIAEESFHELLQKPKAAYWNSRRNEKVKQKKKVFLCYAREDQPLMDDFYDRFKNYNEADMEILYDRNANSRNMHEVFSEFANQCDVAILLVNAQFVNPESYANKYEIPVLLDRQKNGEVVVVGVRFSNVSDLEEWNAEGDVYFFSLTNNDLHYTRDKSPKNEAFLRKFAIYDKVDDRDRDEYHDRLRHWIKSAIFFNKEKNLQIEGKVEGSQLILTSFSNNFNVELKNSTILLTYLISFALEDSMKNKEAKIENIELWVTQNVYQITSKSLKDVYFAELLSQIDAFQNNIKSEIDKEIRLIGYKVNYFKLSGSALEVKNSFSFDFNEFEQEFDTNLGDTVRLNIVVNGRIIDYYHENLKHTLTPETDLAKQIKKEIRSEVRKFILLCKPEQYYLEFNSVLLPELEKILRGNLIEQYNVAQDIGIVVKFLGSKLITRLQNLMKGFITSTVQYQNGKLKLKIKFNVEGVRKNRWDRFANRNYKSAKEEQENLSDELRVHVENTMRKEFGKIPLVAISTMADIVKQFAILSIEPIGENTGLTIRITSVEVLNMSSSTLVDNSLKKEQDIFNQKKHNTNNSETVNILKRFTSRLNAYASIYGSTIPTEIPPSVIIEIQTLCHEISTYINTNHPNIEQDNLEAFYSIYDRTNGLVSLVQRKEGTTQFYFRELRHLLSDLRNISL